MGKTGDSDAKNAEKIARKKAKKEAKDAKKEAKRRKKEEKELKKAARKQQLSNTTFPVTSEDDDGHVQDSVFHHKKVVSTVSILPSAMGNTKVAIEAALRRMLLKYVENLGVVMSFRNIEIISNNGTGMLLWSLPYIHYKVRFDAVVFCPIRGSKISGQVYESFESHLGVMVLGFLNAMIPSERLVEAGYSFDIEKLAWVSDDGSKVLTNGDAVDLTVEKAHNLAGIFSMEGSNPEPTSGIFAGA